MEPEDEEFYSYLHGQDELAGSCLVSEHPDQDPSATTQSAVLKERTHQ